MKRLNLESMYNKTKFIIQQRGPVHMIEVMEELRIGISSFYRLRDYIKIYHSIDMTYNETEKKFDIINDMIQVADSELVG